MEIRVQIASELSSKNKKPGTAVLIKDDWNDWWEYKNQYYAHYITQDGGHLELGLVKIEDPELAPQDQPEHPLELGYDDTEIDQDLVSLGQTDSYYETLSKLLDVEREAFCVALRDAVWNPRRLKENKRSPAVRNSLLREVSLASIDGEFNRILRRDGEENYYHLQYCKDSLRADFIVNPKSQPRTNLHAVIGRNGVGKTTLLRRIAAILATDCETPGESFAIFDEDGKQSNEGVIAGIQYVSWGPFDKFEDAENWELSPGVSYAQIGLTGIRQLTPDGDFEKPKVKRFEKAFTGKEDDNPSASFARAFGLVVQRVRNELWLDAVQALDSDPEFRRLKILQSLRGHLADAVSVESTGSIDYDAIADEFKDLSEGHQVVLLTVTYIAATLAERTLVVLDEPEAHLHPPLLSSLILCLTDLLARKNAMSIVATHSPVVLQEIPKECVLVISGKDKAKKARPPRIETYGEDISALTHEVFGLEVEDSGFYRTLKELASRFDDYDEALDYIGGNLGVVGRSVLRSLIAFEHDSIDIS